MPLFRESHSFGVHLHGDRVYSNSNLNYTNVSTLYVNSLNHREQLMQIKHICNTESVPCLLLSTATPSHTLSTLANTPVHTCKQSLPFWCPGFCLHLSHTLSAKKEIYHMHISLQGGLLLLTFNFGFCVGGCRTFHSPTFGSHPGKTSQFES